MDERLIGHWRIDSTDRESVESFGESRIEIGRDRLVYVHPDGAASILTIKECREGFLVTDQPSSPRLETTRYFFPSEDILILEFGRTRSRFKRSPPPSSGIPD